VLARGERVVVVAGSSERVEALNAALWTYDDRSFLPHGSKVDGFAEDQPVWLSDAVENPNGARVLVVTEGMAPDDPASWSTVIEMFDGNDAAATEAARQRWSAYKAAGHNLVYWTQDQDGRWLQG
jgi:DNA polymerase III subunit chi